ncbi:hypothetical protein MKW98_024957 [Papaver atlanticum]|uniref:TF-B3 domain-containing protein n=1 Tax=Papaver atlanticum TaxID=357466 RepID=A0AAD4SZG2_9MAGN|nr:hypothetical protein MKW98_024957 [Papaver atlanticum]
MLQTHVMESFTVVIPSEISAKYMPKKDIEVTLLDEEGEEQIVKYHTKRHRLGVGWRRFATGHNLSLGDAVVFQLMEINKFKIYIARKTGLAAVDGAFGRLQPEACAQKSSPGKAGNDMKPTRKTVVGKPKRLPLPVVDQPEICSEETDSEYLEGIRFTSSVPEFEDTKNIESFTIIYNDLIIDSEMSKHVKSRYYELCCSQNSFLHKNLVPGLNCKLVAGMISETVNISDAVRSGQVSSSSRDVLQVWRKSLEAFEHLDMNVGFLLTRLDELVKMASESEQAVDLFESKKRRSN